MADAVEFFFRTAKTILMVDKYFGPENSRHRSPFQEMMSRIYLRDKGTAAPRVAVHCSPKSDIGFFQSECQNRLASVIPLGNKVEFHRWNCEDLQNRFILTELGGVAFLEGLDEFVGKGRHEDVLVLLDTDVSIKLIQDYTPDLSRLRHLDCFEIAGTGLKPEDF